MSNYTAKFFGIIPDDGKIDLTISEGSIFAKITGQFPNLRIDRALDTRNWNANRASCVNTALSFVKINP
jgi:hypothetical protein